MQNTDNLTLYSQITVNILENLLLFLRYGSQILQVHTKNLINDLNIQAFLYELEQPPLHEHQQRVAQHGVQEFEQNQNAQQVMCLLK